MIAPAATSFPADRRFVAALYLLVMLSITVFCQLHETATPLVFTIVAALVAWLLVDSARGRPLPKLLINIFLVGVSLNFWREAWDGENFNLMTSLGHFITGLMVCKFFERKGPRDVTQVLILSLLIVIASTMYSSSMSFAFVLIAYFGVLIYTVILMHLRLQSQVITSSRRWPSVFPGNGQHALFARDIRRTAFRSLVVLLPVALLVFLAMPRSRGSAFLSRWNPGSFQTGFSEEVHFQDYGQLTQSDAVAMEVYFYQNNVNVGAEIVEPYFRGLTLENYDETLGRWSHEHDEEVEVRLDEDNYGLLVPATKYFETSPLRQEYRLRQPNRTVLFHVAPPLSVSMGKRARISFSRGSDVLTPTDFRSMPSSYTVESLARSDPSVYNIPPRRINSDEPSGPIKRLARNLVADLLPPGDAPLTREALTPERIQLIASRFESYLRSNYTYSLEFRREDPNLEPITDFLMNHQKLGGHCEYFAAAMVMLCRSVNIDARMVTGYHGGEFNSLLNCFTVLQRNAHAWVEYYVPGTGWVQSDPSPIAVNSPYSSSIVTRWLQELTQIIENAWLSAVVTFDNDSRLAVVAWFTGLLSVIRTTDIWKADLWTRVAFALACGGLLGVFYYVMRAMRRDRQRWAQSGPSRKHVRLSGDTVFLDELFRLIGRTIHAHEASHGKSGVNGRRLDQTPREYIEAAAPALGAAAEDARWLVGMFYGVHFGGVALTGTQRKEIAQAMRRVREALRPHGELQAARA